MTAGRQTWLGSIVEMKSNLLIGYPLNYLTNLVTLPLLYDRAHNFRSAFLIGCVFTVVSVCRQLVIRRWFNGHAFGNVPLVVPVESLGREHA